MPVAEVAKAPAGSGNGIPWPGVDRAFVTQGWAQHVLPDSFSYFSHEGMRVTTDIDLRNSKKLDTLTQYLHGKDRNGPVLPPSGWELFLRDAGKHQYDFSPIKSFVNHNDRILTFNVPQTVDVGAISEDDSTLNSSPTDQLLTAIGRNGQRVSLLDVHGVAPSARASARESSR